MLNEFGYSEDESTYKIVDGGEHRASMWGPEFREAYLWLFPEATSSTGISFAFTDLEIYPNPAHNTIYVKTDLSTKEIKIQIFNLSGTEVKSYKKIT